MLIYLCNAKKNSNVLAMKKHVITTLFTTVISCTTAFAQADGDIGANGDEGTSSGTIFSYLKEADIDYVGDGLIGHKLDIYYPDDGKETHNVIIHIYGSAWRSNNSKGSADLGTVGLAALKQDISSSLRTIDLSTTRCGQPRSTISKLLSAIYVETKRILRLTIHSSPSPDTLQEVTWLL